MSTKDSFVLVKSEAYPTIVEILKSRLPKSGNVYNMARSVDKFQEEMKCYSWKGCLDPDALIMITFTREDYGQDINISLPNDFIPSDKLREGFTSTKAIHWRAAHLFVALDRRISTLLFEIDTKTFRNSVIFNPTYSYWISAEDAKKFETQVKDNESVVLKPLDKISGLTFFTENWRSKRPGSGVYIRKMIDNHLSAGVYINGKLASAAVISGYGFIGPIITAGGQRRHGYATKGMKFLLHEMGKAGFAPVSSSAQGNLHYVALHEKLGMTLTHEADWIFHTGVPTKNSEGEGQSPRPNHKKIKLSPKEDTDCKN